MKLLPLLSDKTVRTCTIAASGLVASRAMFKMLWSLILERNLTDEETDYIFKRSYQLWAIDNPEEARRDREAWLNLARNPNPPNVWRTQHV